MHPFTQAPSVLEPHPHSTPTLHAKRTPQRETYPGTRNAPRHPKRTTPRETHHATRNMPRHMKHTPALETYLGT
jgi:hypothetical protein